MAEKVNKSYTPFHYHSLINLCVFYLSSYLAQRKSCLNIMVIYMYIAPGQGQTTPGPKTFS